MICKLTQNAFAQGFAQTSQKMAWTSKCRAIYGGFAKFGHHFLLASGRRLSIFAKNLEDVEPWAKLFKALSEHIAGCLRHWSVENVLGGFIPEENQRLQVFKLMKADGFYDVLGQDLRLAKAVAVIGMAENFDLPMNEVRRVFDETRSFHGLDGPIDDAISKANDRFFASLGVKFILRCDDIDRVYIHPHWTILSLDDAAPE